MKLVEKEISLEELQHMSTKMFDNLVKAVIDIEKEIMIVDTEMHADGETLLLEMGSKQRNLWGINFHPHKYPREEWVTLIAIINFRPSQNNFTISIED